MVADYLSVTLLSVWLALAVWRQFDNRPSVWRWDIFCLIPRWTFFAPDPVQSDHLLLFRSRGEDLTPESWRPSPFPRRRSLGELLLNPRSRCHRLQYILILRSLEELRGGKRSRQDCPHLQALSDLVNSLPPRETGSEREFVVLQSFGFVSERPPKPVLSHPASRTES